jgi:uncharacterized repeat protein (TIGR01451 family)
MRAKLYAAVVSLCALLGAGGAFGATRVATPTVPPTQVFTPTPTPTSNRTADLSVTKVASPSPVLLGQELNYTLTIHNSGPSNALSVSLQDNLPADVTLVSANFPGGTCSFSSLQVQCSLSYPGNLPAGGNVQAVIVVKPTKVGPITNSALVRSSAFDPNPNNNGASVTTEVKGPKR